MFKNVASQRIVVYATLSGTPQTGDAGNITAYLDKDGGGAVQTDDVNPTELDATNLKGLYAFDMLQEETNADLLALSPVSSTSNVTLEPVIIYTVTAMRGTDNANTTVPDAAGVAPTATEIVDEWEAQSQGDPTGFHVNVLEIGGTSQTANDNGADINAILVDTGTTIPALIAALNDPTAAEIATAVMAKVVDGTLDVTEALKILVAVLAGDIAKSSDTYTYDEQDGTVKLTEIVGVSAVTRTIA